MTLNTKLDRRSFLKVSSTITGGFMLSFGCIKATPSSLAESQEQQSFNMNGYLTIHDNGLITIQSTNPEIGQNIKTSMPMIIAEELDADWSKVKVVQAGLNSVSFKRQVAGGSQSIHKSWETLRNAGATARQMLVNAAAKKWKVSADVLTTDKGFIIHPKGKKVHYGEIASLASTLAVPENVVLKDPKDFTIIGTRKKNVDTKSIITGKPLFGIDTKREGMLYACVLRMPAFGMRLTSFDDTESLKVKGVIQTVRFGDKIAVLANSTWASINGKKALKAEWEVVKELEDSTKHDEQLLALLDKEKEHKGEKGDAISALSDSEKVIERVYEAPFLPHNTLEPMNFFASVTDEKVELYGPTQTPASARKQVARLLKRPESEISVGLSRMGGGFGRRLKADYVLEAAEISDKVRKPIQLLFTREDDMTTGAAYRPASKYKIKAGIKNNEMIAYHLVGSGINQGNSARNRTWPMGSVKNYLTQSHRLKSNITTCAWRSPVCNFIAFAEQTFMDEVAESVEKDPIDFRIVELLEKAKGTPRLPYEADRFIGVLNLVSEKSNWTKKSENTFKGVSMYFSHDTYVAEVAEVKKVGSDIKIINITVAVDCGIVINPSGAEQQAAGGVLDGIGHAMYGEMLIKDGKPQADNFNQYELIRMKDAPKVDVHFVKSKREPTGMGEPTLPPAAAALANAIYAATAKRLYKQPFVNEGVSLG